jgi:hypothetical protein
MCIAIPDTEGASTMVAVALLETEGTVTADGVPRGPGMHVMNTIWKSPPTCCWIGQHPQLARVTTGIKHDLSIRQRKRMRLWSEGALYLLSHRFVNSGPYIFQNVCRSHNDRTESSNVNQLASTLQPSNNPLSSLSESFIQLETSRMPPRAIKRLADSIDGNLQIRIRKIHVSSFLTIPRQSVKGLPVTTTITSLFTAPTSNTAPRLSTIPLPLIQ